jgi:hypothetical protein
MGFLDNLFKAAVDVVAAPVKVVSKTLDGENPLDAVVDSLEDVKDDFEDQ